MNIKVGSEIESDFGRGKVIVITKGWLIYEVSRTGEEVCLSRENDEYWIPVTEHTTGSGSSASAATLDVLNTAFRADPGAIHSLLCNRVPCNQALVDSESVVVDTAMVLQNDSYNVGMLGVLNGVLWANGLPRVASMFSDGDDQHDGPIFIGFCEYAPDQPDDTAKHTVVMPVPFDKEEAVRQLGEIPPVMHFDRAEDTQRRSYSLVDALSGESGSLDVTVDLEKYRLGMAIVLRGYGLHDMEPNVGGVVFLELYEGTARLLVWADITASEPTHVISLEGAKESKRLPDE